MEVDKQYCLFILLFKVVLTLKSVNEMLNAMLS